MARQTDLMIYSGTIDILELPYTELDGRETTRRIYLDYVNQTIPVPKFFFKAIIDRTKGQGVVLISK